MGKFTRRLLATVSLHSTGGIARDGRVKKVSTEGALLGSMIFAGTGKPRR